MLLLYVASGSFLIWVLLIQPWNHRISQTVSDVEGFELRHIGSNRPDAFFLAENYVIAANYPFFNYRGDTYEKAGVNGAIIRRNHQRATNYVVEETSLINENSSILSQLYALLYGGTQITIRERNSGKTLASRRIKRGQVEDEHGWEHEHATMFVLRVLQPKNFDHKKRLGILKSYPETAAKFTTLPFGETLELGNYIVSCPEDYVINRNTSLRRLTTRNWHFLPQAPLQYAACSGEYVFVFSSVFPNELFIDVITKSGVFVTQTEVRLPIPMGAYMIRLDSVSYTRPNISFELWYAKNESINNRYQRLPFEHLRLQLPIS